MEMVNSLYNLTDPQKKSLEEFKKYLSDILTPDYTDATLLKWLRARNFDPKAAQKIFRVNYNNRIIFDMNSIVDTYEEPEVGKIYGPNGVIGFAKDGTLIRYVGVGRFDFYGFIMSLSCFDLSRYLGYILEIDIHAAKEESIRTGRDVDEITYVIDVEGFSIQQLFHKSVLEMVLDYTRILQDCYPEVWRIILIVNAPAIFDKGFNMFKHLIRASYFEKLKIVDKASTRNLLLQYIDEDILPAFLGGTRVDSKGDPNCKEFINFGGTVPEEFYSQNSSLPILSLSDPGVMAFSIGARSFRNFSSAVYQVGTKIRTEMRSEDGSINLVLFYKPFGDDPKNPKFPSDNEYLENDDNSEYEMVTIEMKAQIHCSPLDLCLYCARPGVYVSRLSNISSWFTSRKILCRFTMIPPSIESTE